MSKCKNEARKSQRPLRLHNRSGIKPQCTDTYEALELLVRLDSLDNHCDGYGGGDAKVRESMRMTMKMEVAYVAEILAPTCILTSAMQTLLVAKQHLRLIAVQTQSRG